MNHTKEPQFSLKARSGGRAGSSDQQVDVAGKQFADLSRHINAGCFAIASVLPKGALEVVRIELTCLDRRGEHSRIIDDLQLYAEASAWLALRDHRATAGSNSSGSSASGAGNAATAGPPEQRPQIAAAPLANAVFEGYPGVLLAYRNHDDRRYSSDDLERLAVCAREISESLRSVRQQHAPANAAIAAGEMPAGQRFIALDADGRPWMNPDGFNAMDDQLRSNLLQAVSQLSRSDGEDLSIEDTEIADSLNRLRTVRLAMRPKPGAGSKTALNGHHIGGHHNGGHHNGGHNNGGHTTSGPMNGSKRKETASASPQVLCCFTPPASDWMRLRPDDFTADAETKRLVPAIHFMAQDVGDQPGLYEIADSVGLSPFHFHRRFTELFGITPKHLLLSAQIAHARQLLSNPEQALAEIARVCGFAHQSHFTSRFKQATGLTPTRWRRVMTAEKAGQNAAR